MTLPSRAECNAPNVGEPQRGLDVGRATAHRRQPGLDLLRALAIIFVVVYHSAGFGFALPHEWHRFGWVGVDLFFVLSGYLIGGQLLAQLHEQKSIHFGRFYARRALRILPAYLVILGIYFGLPSWREQTVISPLWKYLLSVQNIDLRPGTAFSHAWSLAVEDQFYLLLPVLLTFLVRSRRAAIAFPTFVFVGGLLLRAALVKWQADSTGQLSGQAYFGWIYYPTWSRLDPLVFGVVLAAIERHRTAWWTVMVGWGRWLWIPAIAAVSGGLYLSENASTLAGCVWKFPMIAIGMAALLVCSVSPSLPFHRIHIPGAALLARIAYSTYLSHKIVVHFVAGVFSRHSIAPASLGGLLALYLIVAVCGTALYYAVERPFLLLRNRIPA
jgi:peptidoglycan/LPS O-acetylase OafA/YrhL